MRFKRKILRDIPLLPTVVTLGNTICGFLAIITTGQGDYPTAAWLILAAMGFDALDGKVARATGSATKFGSQLDSMSDAISFGVAPAYLVVALCSNSQLLHPRIVMAGAAFYAVCAVLRLARFTVESPLDEEFHREFAGLPSPGAAGVIASIVIPWQKLQDGSLQVNLANLLPIIAFVIGILMVSRFKYMHIINRLFKGFRPFVSIVQLSIATVILILLYEFAIFLAFAFYALSGPVSWVWIKWRLSRKAQAPAQEQIPPQNAEEEEPLF